MSKIIFFGGKGGVGKTSCSVAYALKESLSGRKTLLVSTDPAHSTSDLFDIKIGDEIIFIKNNLYALEIDAQRESAKYMEKIQKNLHRIISPIILEELKKQIQLASISPGSHESALFDKMIEIITKYQEKYDLIIFDTAPTGHTVRLVSLPELLGAWIDTLIQKRRKILTLKKMIANIKKGKSDIKKEDAIIDILLRRKNLMEEARKIMIDEKKLSFFFVLNAEYLSIEETKRAILILEKYHINIKALVVNKILPEINNNVFWESKKAKEKENLQQILKLGINKVYIVPLLDKDMDRNSIEEISKFL